MRVLLDENVDIGLRRELIGHEVATVAKIGWGALRNGELLRRAELSFDVLLTCDRSMEYQQNIQSFDIAVIVLVARSNDLEHLQPLVPKILAALEDDPVPGTVTHVGTLFHRLTQPVRS